jgi:hypothetical protein
VSRRVTDDDRRASGNGFTIKEVVLNIERDVLSLTGKLDGYIAIHQGQHVAEQSLSAQVRAQPKASPAGQSLLDDIQAVADAHRETRDIVMVHERTIQRLFGATALASALGLGTIVFMIFRTATGQ